MSIPTISSGKNNYYDLGPTRKYDIYRLVFYVDKLLVFDRLLFRLVVIHYAQLMIYKHCKVCMHMYCIL